ncbi:Cytochrome P450 2K1 [Channa argus]|uniref:Cytochrome P450 2K1 n=1 Tax=Channa argus TaxID=215402 RepID=A0A6G1QCV9_CHAAH|nr:Cytochrome P450 2K1 [Channa argus]
MRQEPPGPRPLPLLGNILQLDLQRPYRTLCELSKKYGSVFTVYFGSKKVVVLAGYKTVKEALVEYAEEFGERDILPIFYDVNHGHGILFANGESWKELRRFSLTTLRDFGMGKPFNPKHSVNYATSNIISSIVYGSRFEYDDPQFQSLVRQSNENLHVIGSASVQLYNMFPRLFGWIKNRQVVLKNTESNRMNSRSLIENLKETLNPHICRGLVDCFLNRKQKAEDSHTNSHYTETNLVLTVSNLFVAGTDTTSATLRWALLLMAKYPHIQGRRVCLGESLAKMELFLFFTSLLQHFRFTPPPGVTEDELDLTPAVGFTLCPLPQKLCAVSRQG